NRGVLTNSDGVRESKKGKLWTKTEARRSAKDERMGLDSRKKKRPRDTQPACVADRTGGHRPSPARTHQPNHTLAIRRVLRFLSWRLKGRKSTCPEVKFAEKETDRKESCRNKMGS